MKTRWLVLSLIVAALLGATGAAVAQEPRHPDAEVGILLGGNWADKDLAGDGSSKDASLWLGLRLARDIGRNWNFFLDGGYASHESSIPTEDLSLIEARLGLEKLFPLGQGRTSLFVAGALGGADAGMPSPIDDFGRPLASGGVGLVRTFDSGNRFRMELRAEELLGNSGLGGADITNIQLLFGYTFGLFESEREADSDGDGVADSKDVCPNTPRGALVDARGCPLDSDGDGVYDGIDRCPDTPRGTEVDAKGCPIKKAMFEEGKKTLVLEGVNFEFDSAKLTSDSYDTLDRAAKSLKEWPEIRVEVGGHTDSDGEDEYNRTLSQSRSEAVRDYLVSKGVQASRLEAKGYGESRPVADNGTAEGRAKNRRVELTKLGD